MAVLVTHVDNARVRHRQLNHRVQLDDERPGVIVQELIQEIGRQAKLSDVLFRGRDYRFAISGPPLDS